MTQEFLHTIDEEGQSGYPFKLHPQFTLDGYVISAMDSSYYNDDANGQIRNRMIILLVWTVAIAMLATAGLVIARRAADDSQVLVNNVAEVVPAQVIPAVTTGISPVFSPTVQHWASRIVEWANQFGVDPNMVATIMQIESCGDPQAESWAGAQGLFQVMPFHFLDGENMKDPNTNAYRGVKYFTERLAQTGGEVGLAFAGYNGGHGAAATGWDSWAAETQRYYVWATGIYADASGGQTVSTTLQEWMAAGGASLCNQAAARLGVSY